MNFGMSSSEQQSKTVTGLRGTGYEGPAAAEAYKEGKRMSDLNETVFKTPQSMMDFGRQMIPSGRYGLGENADTGVEQYGKFLFGNTSADYAGRGHLSPENQAGVIGSAIVNSLPFLIPQMQQFQLGQFMAPQSLQQMAKTSADYWNRALGAQSEARGQSDGFNFGIFNVPVTSGGGSGGN